MVKGTRLMLFGHRLAYLAYVRYLEVPTDMLPSEETYLNDSVMKGYDFCRDVSPEFAAIYASVVRDVNRSISEKLTPYTRDFLDAVIRRREKAVAAAAGLDKSVSVSRAVRVTCKMLDDLVVLDWDRPFASETLADEVFMSLPDEGGHVYVSANNEWGMVYGKREYRDIETYLTPGSSVNPVVLTGDIRRLCSACCDQAMKENLLHYRDRYAPVVAWRDVSIDFIDTVFAHQYRHLTGGTLARREKHIGSE